MLEESSKRIQRKTLEAYWKKEETPWKIAAEILGTTLRNPKRTLENFQKELFMETNNKKKLWIQTWENRRKLHQIHLGITIFFLNQYAVYQNPWLLLRIIGLSIQIMPGDGTTLLNSI